MNAVSISIALTYEQLSGFLLGAICSLIVILSMYGFWRVLTNGMGEK